MNDIEFARTISPRIGTLYGEAKGCHTELPAHALNCLRGTCHLLCDLLAEHGGVAFPVTGDLDRKIYLLFSHDVVDSETRERLTQLRVNGNKGAHPEKFFQAHSDFLALADQSLGSTCVLLEMAHRRL